MVNVGKYTICMSERTTYTSHITRKTWTYKHPTNDVYTFDGDTFQIHLNYGLASSKMSGELGGKCRQTGQQKTQGKYQKV